MWKGNVLDVSKHLYVITVMLRNSSIKSLLNNKVELNKLISYKRKEELSRLGGILESKRITNFDYMKMDFSEKLISAFDKMQRIYVLDDKCVVTINEVKNAIRLLLGVFEDL